MKVTAIQLGQLRNSEYLQYMKDYLYAYEIQDPVVLDVEAEFNALTANVDAIEAVFKQDQASELTAVIADLDITRDQYIISIAAVAKAYMGHYDESKVQMAESVYRRISVYGSGSEIAHETLESQTNTINNLVDDLQNDPVLSAGITALGLTDWVGQLQLVNSNLEDAYRERTGEWSDAQGDTIKQLRAEGYDLYYQLRDMLLARALIAGYAFPYDKVIKDTNTLSDGYNRKLARRSGGSEVDPEDDGGDNDVGQE